MLTLDFARRVLHSVSPSADKPVADQAMFNLPPNSIPASPRPSVPQGFADRRPRPPTPAPLCMRMNARPRTYYAPASPTRRVAAGRGMQQRTDLISLGEAQRTRHIVYHSVRHLPELDEDELPALYAEGPDSEEDSDSDEELGEEEEFEEMCMPRVPAGHVQQTYLSLSEAQSRRDIKYRREGFEMQDARQHLKMIRAELFA